MQISTFQLDISVFMVEIEIFYFWGTDTTLADFYIRSVHRGVCCLFIFLSEIPFFHVHSVGPGQAFMVPF